MGSVAGEKRRGGKVLVQRRRSSEGGRGNGTSNGFRERKVRIAPAVRKGGERIAVMSEEVKGEGEGQGVKGY